MQTIKIPKTIQEVAALFGEDYDKLIEEIKKSEKQVCENSKDAQTGGGYNSFVGLDGYHMWKLALIFIVTSFFLQSPIPHKESSSIAIFDAILKGLSENETQCDIIKYQPVAKAFCRKVHTLSTLFNTGLSLHVLKTTDSTKLGAAFATGNWELVKFLTLASMLFTLLCVLYTTGALRLVYDSVAKLHEIFHNMIDFCHRYIILNPDGSYKFDYRGLPSNSLITVDSGLHDRLREEIRQLEAQIKDLKEQLNKIKI